MNQHCIVNPISTNFGASWFGNNNNNNNSNNNSYNNSNNNSYNNSNNNNPHNNVDYSRTYVIVTPNYVDGYHYRQSLYLNAHEFSNGGTYAPSTTYTSANSFWNGI